MLQEMILQNRNHPSIILWGMRINESVDDDAVYNRTNKIAQLSRKWLPVLPKGRTIPGKEVLKYRFGHLFCRFLPILQCFLQKRLYK